MAILTPCKGICKQHPTYKVCIGCYRTELEKEMWLHLYDEGKIQILEDLEIKKELFGNLNP